VLLAGVAIAFLCTYQASETFKDTLSRVRTFEISNLKIELNQIRTRQERQSSPSLDLLCVPGGSYGVVRAIGDRETIEFVRRQAGAAKSRGHRHR
jgi:hypothetical protein